MRKEEERRNTPDVASIFWVWFSMADSNTSPASPWILFPFPWWCIPDFISKFGLSTVPSDGETSSHGSEISPWLAVTLRVFFLEESSLLPISEFAFVLKFEGENLFFCSSVKGKWVWRYVKIIRFICAIKVAGFTALLGRPWTKTKIQLRFKTWWVLTSAYKKFWMLTLH